VSDDEKTAQRNAAAVEACRGIPTDTLLRIAALPVPDRPAALAEAATKQAKRSRVA
jgi:hypothetical protein